MEYIVYMHRNKINNKVYIGQTCMSLKKRWQNGRGYYTQIFGRAIKKYGWDNFEHVILEQNLTKEQADEKEKYWIKFYNSTDTSYGYNVSTGGSKEYKVKNQWDEQKKKEYSDRMKKRWEDHPEMHEEKRKLIIKINKQLDRTGKNNSMYGRDRKGANAGNKKRVQCIETGQIFETITDAAKWSNNGKVTTKTHISAVCKRKRKTCGKHPITGQPLTWRYV